MMSKYEEVLSEVNENIEKWYIFKENAITNKETVRRDLKLRIADDHLIMYKTIKEALQISDKIMQEPDSIVCVLGVNTYYKDDDFNVTQMKKAWLAMRDQMIKEIKKDDC